MRKRQERLQEIRIDIETQLLLQGYAREVSRAHTIFEVYWQIILALIFGNFTILSFVFDKKLLPWNKFYFYIILIINLFIVIIITYIAFRFWYGTRLNRSIIVSKIKKLNLTT